MSVCVAVFWVLMFRIMPLFTVPGKRDSQNCFSLSKILSPFRTGSSSEHCQLPRMVAACTALTPSTPPCCTNEQTLQVTQGVVNTHLGFPFPRVSFEAAQFLWAPFTHTCTRTEQHTTLCLNTKNRAWGIVPDVQQASSLARKPVNSC